MADTDILIKDLPLTETVNDSDDLVTEDSSPTTHRIKASVVKNYINAEQNEKLDGLNVDLDNVNSNIGSLSSKVDDATTAVSSMQTNLNSMDGRVSANADGISELNSALTENATPIEVISLISTVTITNNNSYYHNGIVYISFSCSNTGNWATSSSTQTQTDFAQIDTKYVQANPTSVALAASLSANGLIVQGAYLLNASNDAKIRLLATGSSSASPQNLYVSGSYYIGAV